MKSYTLLATRTLKLLAKRTLYYIVVNIENLMLLICHILSLAVWPVAIALGASIKQLESTASERQLPRGQ